MKSFSYYMFFCSFTESYIFMTIFIQILLNSIFYVIALILYNAVYITIWTSIEKHLTSQNPTHFCPNKEGY